MSEHDFALIASLPSGDGISHTRIYWCRNTGTLRSETKSDGRYRAGGGPVVSTPANAAHIEAQAAEIARLRDELGECFRLAGGDTDGNPGPHHAHRAVEVVRDLRECYEERGNDLEKAEAEVAALHEDSRRLDWLERHPDAIRRSRGYRGAADSWSMRLRPEDAAQDFDTLRAAIDDAMRGGAE